MTSEQKNSKVLTAFLWITQVILSLTFIWAGAMKLFQPQQLPFPWVKDNSTLVIITGIIDLLAGIGILFPALLNVQPKLTIYAAYGIIMLMIAATVFHISRGEAKDIGFNVFVTLTAAFIAWGKQKKALPTKR